MQVETMVKVCGRIKYQLYIRSSEVKSKDFAICGEVNTPLSDAATEM